jgi:hypothetical protein
VFDSSVVFALQLFLDFIDFLAIVEPLSKFSLVKRRATYDNHWLLNPLRLGSLSCEDT